MEISIYSSDVRDFDEQVESFLDIRHRWGANIFDENDRLTLKDYDYALEPYTYIAIMCDIQEQINDLVTEIKQLKQDGWSTK
jgi:hypothetical protein